MKRHVKVKAKRANKRHANEAPCYIKGCKEPIYGTVLARMPGDIPDVPFNTCRKHQTVVAGTVIAAVEEAKKKAAEQEKAQQAENVRS